MRGGVVLAAVAVLAGCSGTRHLQTSEENRRDSVRTEVVTKTYFVTDTVFVEIPAQTAERTTRDSVSRLENDYATSEARINADGTLYHDLLTKPQRIAREAEMPVERRDSIVYRDRYRTVTDTVEVERPLRMKDWAWPMAAGVLAGAAAALWLVRKRG